MQLRRDSTHYPRPNKRDQTKQQLKYIPENPSAQIQSSRTHKLYLPWLWGLVPSDLCIQGIRGPGSESHTFNEPWSQQPRMFGIWTLWTLGLWVAPHFRVPQVRRRHPEAHLGHPALVVQCLLALVLRPSSSELLASGGPHEYEQVRQGSYFLVLTLRSKIRGYQRSCSVGSLCLCGLFGRRMIP